MNEIGRIFYLIDTGKGLKSGSEVDDTYHNGNFYIQSFDGKSLSNKYRMDYLKRSGEQFGLRGTVFFDKIDNFYQIDLNGQIIQFSVSKNHKRKYVGKNPSISNQDFFLLFSPKSKEDLKKLEDLFVSSGISFIGSFENLPPVH